MNTRLLLASIATTMLFAAPVLAQEPDPGHPRINQVDNRLSSQENNTMNAEQNGKLTAGQATRDESQDQRIQNQEQRQAAANGGHLTKREQRRDNREMNRVRREKARQERHDRRAAHAAHAHAHP